MAAKEPCAPSDPARSPPQAGPSTHAPDTAADCTPRINPRFGFTRGSPVTSPMYAELPALAAAPPAPTSRRAAIIVAAVGATPVSATPQAAAASPTIISGRRPFASAKRPNGELRQTRANAGAARTSPTPELPSPKPKAYCGSTGTMAPKLKLRAAVAAVTTLRPAWCSRGRHAQAAARPPGAGGAAAAAFVAAAAAFVAAASSSSSTVVVRALLVCALLCDASLACGFGTLNGAARWSSLPRVVRRRVRGATKSRRRRAARRPALSIISVIVYTADVRL